MKILTRKSQDEAGKLLTAMLIMLNSGIILSNGVYEQMIHNISDLSYIVGGMEMVDKVGKSAYKYMESEQIETH